MFYQPSFMLLSSEPCYPRADKHDLGLKSLWYKMPFNNLYLPNALENCYQFQYFLDKQLTFGSNHNLYNTNGL